MRTSVLIIAVAGLLSSASHTWAASTPEEANQIKAVVERYLGNKPGVVTVNPTGEGYELIIDAGPWLAQAKSEKFTASISPFHLSLKPLGNGQWDVTQNESVSFTSTIENGQSFDLSLKKLSQTGTFDEALGTFSNSTFEISEMATKQVINDPTKNSTMSVESKTERFSGASKAVANPAGGVDVTGNYDATKTSSSGKISEGSGGTPISYSYTIAASEVNYSAANGKPKALLALASWFIEHPSKDSIVKDQAELKTLLKAAMPFFASMQASGKSTKVEVITQLGKFGIGEAAYSGVLNGFVKDGLFQEKISIEGIAVPAAILPAWTAKLIPKDTSIDISVSGFDAETPALAFIDTMDLSKDPPVDEAFNAAFLQKILPTGKFNIQLNPSQISAPAFNLEYDGNLVVSPAGLPVGKATIKFAGFDATMKALQEAAASEPSVNQAIGPLLAAKGFAKTDGDKLVWIIESNGTGVVVNGVDLSKM